MILKHTFKTPDAGRDGFPSLALLLTTKRRNRLIEEGMKQYLMNTDYCRKDTLFNNFDSYSKISVVPCLCCDICKKSCNCSSCENNYQS